MNKSWNLPNSAMQKLLSLLPDRQNSHPRGGGRRPASQEKVLRAIFFVLRTGIQWKALDATGICSASVAHRYFQRWVRDGIFQKLWQVALEEYDDLKGIDWAWQSMDGAMTKAPLGGEKTGSNPTDRAKFGVKRSLLCEAAGVPIGLAVDGANRHDMKMVRATVESIPLKPPDPTAEKPQNMCLDKGYDYKEVRELVDEFGYTAHIKARGEEAQALKREAGFKARRWEVERTHSWMNRYRRVLIRWEKRLENYIGLLHFTCALITIAATRRFTSKSIQF